MPEDIPLEEVKRLPKEAIEENMLVLQALADQDERLIQLPRRSSVK